MKPKFFIDENIGSRIYEALKILGENVEYVTDNFNLGEKDVILLKYVGQNQIAFITKDKNIKWNPSEIKALKDNGVLAFFISGQNDRCGIIRQLLKSWSSMKEIASKELGRGFRAYSIKKNGGKPTKLIFK
jgi:hypothetical protein